MATAVASPRRLTKAVNPGPNPGQDRPARPMFAPQRPDTRRPSSPLRTLPHMRERRRPCRSVTLRRCQRRPAHSRQVAAQVYQTPGDPPTKCWSSARHLWTWLRSPDERTTGCA